MARVCLVVTVPGLRVKSEMNGTREHYHAKAKRTKAQKVDTTLALNGGGFNYRAQLRAAKRVRVRFTRIGGKTMDDDNCVSAFKFIRDAVAQWLGRDDGPKSGVEWVMPIGQETGSFGVRIEIEEVCPN